MHPVNSRDNNKLWITQVKTHLYPPWMNYKRLGTRVFHKNLQYVKTLWEKYFMTRGKNIVIDHKRHYLPSERILLIEIAFLSNLYVHDLRLLKPREERKRSSNFSISSRSTTFSLLMADSSAFYSLDNTWFTIQDLCGSWFS